MNVPVTGFDQPTEFRCAIVRPPSAWRLKGGRWKPLLGNRVTKEPRELVGHHELPGHFLAWFPFDGYRR